MPTKLSIVTINYNNASGLKKTIESVFCQTSKDFEYIIIDGCSTDESIQVVEQTSNNHLFPFIWLSEKDKGIYHAMNKGVLLAKGEYVQFLNSGDWLVDEYVIEKMLKMNLDYDILIGNIISVRADGKKRFNRQNTDVSLYTFYRSTLPHPSAFIRRSLFDKYGLYDETLKIIADWKWYLIVVGLNGVKVNFTDINVTFFDTTGISNNNKTLEKIERRKALEELIPYQFLSDYDKYYFDIDQMERLKRYFCVYKIVWFIERCLFKLEKFNIKYRSWK